MNENPNPTTPPEQLKQHDSDNKPHALHDTTLQINTETLKKNILEHERYLRAQWSDSLINTSHPRAYERNIELSRNRLMDSILTPPQDKNEYNSETLMCPICGEPTEHKHLYFLTVHALSHTCKCGWAALTKIKALRFFRTCPKCTAKVYRTEHKNDNGYSYHCTCGWFLEYEPYSE